MPARGITDGLPVVRPGREGCRFKPEPSLPLMLAIRAESPLVRPKCLPNKDAKCRQTISITYNIMIIIMLTYWACVLANYIGREMASPPG